MSALLTTHNRLCDKKYNKDYAITSGVMTTRLTAWQQETRRTASKGVIIFTYCSELWNIPVMILGLILG